MVAKLILIDGFILITNMFICAGTFVIGTMLIFDIETNGLLYNVTTIHCLVIYDTETKQTLVFNDNGF